MDIEQAEHILRPLKELRLWDKNPRRGTKKQMAKLRRKIEKHGLYKALITLEDGTILGGNMRFRVLSEMGVTNAWCSVVRPKNEAEKIEIAISDNETDGEWVEEELAELINSQPVELELYSVHLGHPVNLDKMMSLEPADGKKDVSFKARENPELVCPECGHQNVPSAFKPLES